MWTPTLVALFNRLNSINNKKVVKNTFANQKPEYNLYYFVKYSYKLWLSSPSRPAMLPCKLRKVKRLNYIEKYFSSKKYESLSTTAHLNCKWLNLKIKLNHIWLVKYLDSMVIPVTHCHPSVTKICCRIWMLKLPFLVAFTSKLCNKLSTQFKYLNPVISWITNH